MNQVQVNRNMKKMEKIVYKPEETKASLIEKCKDKVFLTGKEKKSEIISLVDDYNEKIDLLTEETTKVVTSSVEQVVENKLVSSSSVMTTNEYLNFKKASSRVRFFITKKYGLSKRFVDEWEEIFKKEGI